MPVPKKSASSPIVPRVVMHSATDVRRNFCDIILRAEDLGEATLVLRNSKPVALIVPYWALQHMVELANVKKAR